MSSLLKNIRRKRSPVSEEELAKEMEEYSQEKFRETLDKGRSILAIIVAGILLVGLGLQTFMLSLIVDPTKLPQFFQVFYGLFAIGCLLSILLAGSLLTRISSVGFERSYKGYLKMRIRRKRAGRSPDVVVI